MSKQADDLIESAKQCFVTPFDGVLRIECVGDGSSLWVDGRPAQPTISDLAPPEVAARFCLWRGEALTLLSVLNGQRRLETAFTAGQMKISGDIAVMARLEMGSAE
ncbi:MAG: SCP2 sterol-binding domain-containing protein [Pseudomonadota bacterium]